MSFKSYLQSNTPNILCYSGIVGFISSAVSAALLTPKAVAKLESDDTDIPEEGYEYYVHKCRLLLPVYAPTIGLLLLSSSLVLGGNQVNHKRNAALTTLYFATQRSLHALKESVLEEVGPKKYEKIQSRADAAPNDKPIPDDLLLGEGTLVWDSFGARYFKVRDVNTMRATINDLHQQLINEDFVSYNDVCHAIGLHPTEFGDEYGWSSDMGGIIHSIGSSLHESTQRPYVILSFDISPKHVNQRWLE